MHYLGNETQCPKNYITAIIYLGISTFQLGPFREADDIEINKEFQPNE
jgi:hypothetical protein